jgi:High potential iron-sulfur protein
MESILPQRRRLLFRAVALLGTSAVATRTNASSCVAADDLDGGLRQSLHYVGSSKDPSQQCNACSFFSEPRGSCGKCTIFNGPADANGHCDSWAKRG